MASSPRQVPCAFPTGQVQSVATSPRGEEDEAPLQAARACTAGPDGPVCPLAPLCPRGPPRALTAK
eukprot:3861185-Pyramimonas_sp.AAC.1